MSQPQKVLRATQPAERSLESAPVFDLSFEDLAQRYNFLNTPPYPQVFTRLILNEIERQIEPARVLDVGCGRGIGRQLDCQREISTAAGELWGIEPDDSVQPKPGLFHNFQHALMETADLPPDSFDLAYSSMVMEHVADPDAFLQAVARALKPTGRYLFLTPNAASFVPFVTKLCHEIRIDEFVVRLVKGTTRVEEYHYPVQFKFNTPQSIERYASRHGFLPPEYAYIEGPGTRSYFPGPLRPIYSLLKLKRRLFKNPRSLAVLICRLTKAS